ncbi:MULTISPECIES: LysR family transcriptional regulator [Pseudomonas]|uniref:LysR family transcriptional regulator n=1 Tax=Pseudomonas TaxID=286 RepID=UPI000D00486E|nr:MULTISPECIES: LysR family transcriptional regulator [Pseudomonas]PRA47303.1 LysR family transcriptional regulator [Pseudomonas sp. MYb115]QXN47936.1 LysR family transcriptional regulator [Pseudomonas fluorescens]WSO22244.1 LysR family transcriptional regulator [Pseudomonas fluorescens]
MSTPDLNLLFTLDALLAEGSVARAAQRLHLSPSAMSRALARLRKVTGDPLLVRAGRGLVPTPRAIELRERVQRLVDEAQSLLRPVEQLDLSQLVRTFTLRTSDGFVENFGPALIQRLRQKAPGVRLYFRQKLNKDSAPLRDGSVDLDTGVVVPATRPELHSRILFEDRFVGVVRNGHPLSQGEITAERYINGQHIQVSRRGLATGLLDETFNQQGWQREVVSLVSGFSAALALTRDTDLIATLPERHTRHLRNDCFSFALPLPTPTIQLSMIWHPRMDADPAHRWLRACLRQVCNEVLGL